MKFIADFHIHSYLSRATSPEGNLENYAKWAKVKGIQLIGTGDFTHPQWFKEIKQKLVEDSPGIYKLKEEPPVDILDGKCTKNLENSTAKFILTVEISSIYKKGDKVRKVHNLIFAPDFETVSKINKALARIGNIESDGRPILGLDSKNLLEIVLNASEHAFIVPAHIWTPWFSILGANSGFDSIEECFEDLTPHIFALETGLSSDPLMNWRISQLDKFTLISNSDAHSPSKLGREANLFDTEMNFYKIKSAIKSKNGFISTVEFYPEEGKYHFDGHRKCNVRLDPQEAVKLNDICPVCNKPITVGVMHRVEVLADRKEPQKPKNAPDYINLIPLHEILSEIYGWGSTNKKLWNAYGKIINRFGSEFDFLINTPIDDIKSSFDGLLAEAIRRVRFGEVKLLAGYDGEFGTISLFDPLEKKSFLGTDFLFDVKIDKPAREKKERNMMFSNLIIEKQEQVVTRLVLNPEQQKAVEYSGKSLIIKAGPGTGKTKTLTERIVYLLENQKVLPQNILAVTFTNKAANEMKERIYKAVGTKNITIGTFHAIGLLILKETIKAAPLIITEEQKADILDFKGKKKFLERLSGYKQAFLLPSDIEDEKDRQLYLQYQTKLDELSAVDYDDLILKPVKILETDKEKRKHYQQRFSYIFIDEYQDVNYAQYCFIKLLTGDNTNICVIGDPNQAIYGFRGSDYRYFLQFVKDYPDALELDLIQNYRSSQLILDGAGNVIKNNKKALVFPLPILPLLPEERAGVRREPERSGEGYKILKDTARLLAVKDIKGEIIYSQLATEKAEAEYIIKIIDRLVGGISSFSIYRRQGEKIEEHVSFKDIAILYRSHILQQPLKDAFEASGIPFQVIGDKPYFTKKGLREVIWYLKAAVYDDALSVKQIQDNKLQIGYIKKLKKQINKAPLDKIVEKLLIYCNNEDLTEDQQRFITFSGTFEKDITGFMEYLSLNSNTSEYDPLSEKVFLMSIHAAKGLEFPVVFIAGCEENLIPYTLFNKETDIEEERRLFYVAMTRAKTKLYLTSAFKRLMYGSSMHNKPSCFIDEIGADLIQIDKKIEYKQKKDTMQLSLFEI